VGVDLPMFCGPEKYLINVVSYSEMALNISPFPFEVKWPPSYVLCHYCGVRIIFALPRPHDINCRLRAVAFPLTVASL
jgi:DNA-directed RNA polymerase subunit RPC12/RpoP